VPSIFRAFIGGAMGASYACELTPDGLAYRAWEGISFDAVPEMLTPTDEEWAALLTALTKAGAGSWRPRYEPDGMVLDGTHWSLALQTGDLVVDASGSNAYPGGFDEVLGAIRTLLRGRAFS
jgi:hypothetical protein